MVQMPTGIRCTLFEINEMHHYLLCDAPSKSVNLPIPNHDACILVAS